MRTASAMFAWALYLLLALMLASPAAAQNESGSESAQDDAVEEQLPPADEGLEPLESIIPVEELEIRLLPLRRDELEQEVESWVDLIQSRMLELAETQLQVREAEGEERTRLQERVAELSERKTALIGRARVAVDQLRDKGGEVEEYDQYLNAVSGVDVDVSDVSGVWIYLRNWFRSPEGGIKVGINIIKFIVTLLIFWIGARIIGRIVHQAVKRLKKTSELLREFLVNITRKTIMIVGFVVAISMLGVPIGPFVAAIGAAGLVIGLALQGTLSNFASGILILIYRPFDVGDAIDVAGQSGKVESMTLVTTTIVSFDNQKIIVPNNEIWNNVITNVTGRPTRRVDMVFGIGYGDDIDKAKEVLHDVITSHQLVLADPAPNIQVHALGDSSVNFIVRPWAKTEDYWTVYWDVHAEVKRRFDREGISIPFPQMDVHVHREEA